MDGSCFLSWLGSIHWRGSWRQYCFFPEKDTIWSAGCMSGIINFIEKINMEHASMIRKRNK